MRRSGKSWPGALLGLLLLATLIAPLPTPAAARLARVLAAVADETAAYDATCFLGYDAMLGYLQGLSQTYPALLTLPDIGDGWEQMQGLADRDL